MRLFIAEKPSLARAIASAFPSPQKKGDGFIQLPGGDCITWCIGHLLEQAEPEDYSPSYKRWSFDTLPIVPETWQLKPKANTKKQLAVVKKLIKQADQIIHAGDPDREGQLLVDEVLHYCQTAKTKLSQCQRLLVSDLNTNAIKKALGKLQSNGNFAPLSRSALARSRADWLFGMNLTRAYTLKGKQVGYQGVLSIGRVQTPILGMVVKREQEINAFVPHDFYQVEALIRTHDAQTFTAKWVPSEACQGHMDEEGRIINPKLAEHVANRITDKPAAVSKAERQQKKQPPPLPYSLSSLQIDAAKAFGLSAQQVLDICQSLYETHKMISYPRSDCRYLPTEQHQEAGAILSAINRTRSVYQPHVTACDPKRKSRAWNDKQVGAHHGIIPTQSLTAYNKLNANEQRVFDLICRQYLMQFLEDYEYRASRIELIIEGGVFVAQGNVPTKLGWKALFKQDNKTSDELPNVTEQDQLWCEQGVLLTKQTTPPEYFTDASLLAAMTGIAKFVVDKELKKILRDTDGLGTEATRAGIIELLFKRQFLYRQGKQIRPTSAGMRFIESLPASLATPDMTARWEMILNRISHNEADYQSFLNELVANLRQQIDSCQQQRLTALADLPASPKTSPKRRYRKANTASSSKGRRSTKR